MFYDLIADMNTDQTIVVIIENLQQRVLPAGFSFSIDTGILYYFICVYRVFNFLRVM